MEQLIAIIEKGQPFFNAIARNKYLKAIRDGFISVIPIIIFSSIFCLVASVPNIWGFYWPDDINNALWKCYNYSMGILAIACAATTAKHFADAQNRDLPKNNQINFISCMCAAIIGFLLLSSDTIATDAASGFNTTYLGSKGLLTAFIAAFVTGIIYKFFIKRNITVKMPEQVPPNISQTFKDIIPFSVCITVFWVFDIVFRAAFGFCFAQGVIQVFQPLFTAADGYIGLAVIYGAMSLFWFVGVHGPSIVEPAIAAALVANMTDNLAAFQAGQHASAVLTRVPSTSSSAWAAPAPRLSWSLCSASWPSPRRCAPSVRPPSFPCALPLTSRCCSPRPSCSTPSSLSRLSLPRSPTSGSSRSLSTSWA